MDTVRLARQLRALRRRRGWSQAKLAAASGLSRGVVAEIEQGRGDRVTVITLERVVRPLRTRLVCRLDWDGGALDRLLDASHAAIVEGTIRLLRGTGWDVSTEVSFNIRGERGSIDVLAHHPRSRAVLVIEVKASIADLQSTLHVLDRKVRLAGEIAHGRGWTVASVSRLLVVGEGATSRRRVASHAAIFGTTFPDRNWAVRRWLAEPPDDGSPLAGLLFLSMESTAARRRS
jgi:transcriptional regulator with XRE-family HTH domain